MTEPPAIKSIRHIEARKIRLADIIYDDSNPNHMTAAQRTALERTVDRYGFAMDPWVNIRPDGRYTCIDGEHRLRLLQNRGESKVTCKVFGVKPADISMLRQIANKLRGTHDKKADAEEIRKIFDAGELANFSGMIATKQDDFERLLDKYDMAADDKAKAAEPPAKPKSKAGQIYQCGPHRIMCGDSTNPEHLKSLIGDSLIDCIMTDPPYGIDVSGKYDSLTKYDGCDRNHDDMKNDARPGNDYAQFFAAALSRVPLARNNSIYVWMADRRAYDLFQAWEAVGITFHQTLIWHKTSTVLSHTDYQSQHESCHYGFKGTHRFYAGRDESDTYTHKVSPNKDHPSPRNRSKS